MLNHIKEIGRLRDNASFLAYEYLTWLFLVLDREDAQERVSAISQDQVFKEDIKIALGTRLVTCLFNHKEQKTSVTSPLLEESHEIFASLRNGHLVEAMTINVGFSEYSINVQLNATDFALTAVKLKNNYEDNEFVGEEEESLSEQDKTREAVFLRMGALGDLEKVLDAFFHEFLRIRTTTFAQELSTMRKQVEDRLERCLVKAPPRLSENEPSNTVPW
jgi:hypothetical protein